MITDLPNNRMRPDRHGRQLTPPEVAERLRVTAETLRYWRRVGAGPAFIKLSERIVRYPEAAIEEFLSRSATK